MQQIEQFATEISDKLELSDDAKKGVLYGAAAVGAWKLLQAGSDIASGVWKHFLRPRRNLVARYGNGSTAPWAVVTGGADGIGKAYCQELAAAGFNLCIIDKNAGLLTTTAQQLKTQVVSIVYDFADLGTENGFNSLTNLLKSKLEGKDVAVLINNVAEFQHKLLIDAPWNYVLRASNVNAHSYAAMARHFVPGMLTRHAKGYKSAIINVGTCAAEPQNPRYQFSIYGASKAYSHILSSSLQEMYADKIDVMTVIPRQTETVMNPAGFMFTAQPEDHARAVFDQLSYETQTYGTMTHDLEYAMRFKYSAFGFFDKYVQWCNSSRNANLVKIYDKK